MAGVSNLTNDRCIKLDKWPVNVKTSGLVVFEKVIDILNCFKEIKYSCFLYLQDSNINTGIVQEEFTERCLISLSNVIGLGERFGFH